jgi:hypothetical protein
MRAEFITPNSHHEGHEGHEGYLNHLSKLRALRVLCGEKKLFFSVVGFEGTHGRKL